jgi:hypothetical protein
MDDVAGWHYDIKGHFSVKSDYKVHWASEERRMQKARPGAKEVEARMTCGRNYGSLIVHRRSDTFCGDSATIGLC